MVTPQSVPRIRVAVVEDSEPDFVITERLLRMDPLATYDTRWSQSGKEALEVLRTEDTDIALVDHQLRDCTGLDLLKDLRGAGIQIPVIMLTGMEDPAVDQAALEAGAADYLLKRELSVGGLARAIRYALERQRLLDELDAIAHQDALTGMANRRRFMQHLDQAISRASRTAARIGVIYVDLDKFKAVNDTYGHDVGDLVLKKAGSLLSERTRAGDLSARLGGDEFALILEQIESSEQLDAVVNSLRGIFASAALDHGDITIPVRASIGSVISDADNASVDLLLRQADERMYEQKRRRHEAHRPEPHQRSAME